MVIRQDVLVKLDTLVYHQTVDQNVWSIQIAQVTELVNKKSAGIHVRVPVPAVPIVKWFHIGPLVLVRQELEVIPIQLDVRQFLQVSFAFLLKNLEKAFLSFMPNDVTRYFFHITKHFVSELTNVILSFKCICLAIYAVCRKIFFSFQLKIPYFNCFFQIPHSVNFDNFNCVEMKICWHLKTKHNPIFHFVF